MRQGAPRTAQGSAGGRVFSKARERIDWEGACKRTRHRLLELLALLQVLEDGGDEGQRVEQAVQVARGAVLHSDGLVLQSVMVHDSGQK